MKKKIKGSGKTFTISGNKINSDEEYGIIPRAVHSIFQMINQASPIHSHRSNLNNNNSNIKEYCVKVNFIEIYKEELKDLLDSNEKDLQIREDETGNTSLFLFFCCRCCKWLLEIILKYFYF